MTMLPFGAVAPIQRRVVAYILDVLIAAIIPIVGTIVAVSLLVGAATSADPAGGMFAVTFVLMPVLALLELGWFVIYTMMQSGGGSIGMRAQGLRLASAKDGGRIGFWRALLRNVVFGLAGSIVVGYFSPLFDGSGRFQGWHDKASDAVMLHARSSAPQAQGTHVQPVGLSSQPASAQPQTAAFGAPPLPTVAGQPTNGTVAFNAPPRPPLPAPVAPPTGVLAPPVAPVPADLPDETIVAPPRAPGLPDDPLISFVPGVTQPPPSAPAAPVVPAEEPVAPAASPPAAPAAPPAAPPAAAAPALVSPAPDDDDIESTRISIPGHRLIFTWDDGQRASVSGRTVFGRNPEPEPGAVIVAVRDETLSLSKTHFEAGAEPSGGWITDRQSTNGTVIVRDGVRIACPPGQRVPVRLGDAIEIGDRIVTIGGFA